MSENLYFLHNRNHHHERQRGIWVVLVPVIIVAHRKPCIKQGLPTTDRLPFPWSAHTIVRWQRSQCTTFVAIETAVAEKST